MAFIGKHNIDKVIIQRSIKIHKKNLCDGDLCLQADDEVGVYISNPDYKMFNLIIEDPGTSAILFYYPFSSDHRWSRYLVRDYDDNLTDKDGDEEYNCVKVVRGMCDPKWVNDRKKLEKVLTSVDKEKILAIK